VTGGGIRTDRITQLYLHAKQMGVPDPASAAAKIAIMSGYPVEKDGQKLPSEDATAALVVQVEKIEKRTLPILTRLGVV
jgi:hypothetical protein